MTTWKDAPTRTINVDGVTFAYRELGTGSDVPVVFLHHLTAVLDDWDPRIIDGIAAHHRVIAFDNRGVGATGGSVPTTVEQMGTDAIAFIRALGLEQGRPVRVLTRWRRRSDGGAAGARTRPPDDPGRHRTPRWRRHRQDGHDRRRRVPQSGAHAQRSQELPVLSPHPRGQTRRGRLPAPPQGTHRQPRQEESPSRPASPSSRPSGTPDRANPTTCRSSPTPSSSPTATTTSWSTAAHSADMARRLPNAQLKIYPNSGHGGVFQHHQNLRPRRTAIPRQLTASQHHQEIIMTTNHSQHDDVDHVLQASPLTHRHRRGCHLRLPRTRTQGRNPRHLLRPPRRHAGQLGSPDHRPDRPATPRHRLRQPRRRSLHRHRPRHRRVDGRRRLYLHHRTRFQHRRHPLLLPRRDGRPSAGDSNILNSSAN